MRRDLKNAFVRSKNPIVLLLLEGRGGVMRHLRYYFMRDKKPACGRSVAGEKRCFVSALLLAVILAGCATKPPRNGIAVDIDALVSKPISSSQIVQKLGPPLVYMERGGILTYRIAYKPDFSQHYVIPQNMSGQLNRYSLVLVFDRYGILNAHSLIECGLSKGLWTDLRTDIKNYTTAQFKLGKTTRRDMMLSLGTPDLFSPDERFLAYLYYAKIYRTDAFVAEFDSSGRLRGIEKFKGVGDLGSLMPSVKEYEGRTVHLSCYSVKWHPNVDKVHRWWVEGSLPVTKDTGLFLLSDQELLFISREQATNAKPALRLPYSSMGGVPFIKYNSLYVRIRNGALHAFTARDGMVLREAQRFLAEKTTPTRP